MSINVRDDSETSFGLRIGDTIYWVEQPALTYLLNHNSNDYFQKNYNPEDEDLEEPDWFGTGEEF
jgi:hypothetical protein